MSALPNFTMRELLEAGVHFGHKTKRWNPRMSPFLFGVRGDIHIIDLGKTVPMLHQALQAVRDITAGNGRVLFVGTKRQAADIVSESAKRCGQYYINQRWLGGLLTNWNTIQNSIRSLKKIDEQLSNPAAAVGLTKKEQLTLTRERDKLESSLGGIKDMGGLPDLLFIIDTNKEDLAVKEAQKLGIPVVAIIDSNSSPEGIAYPIPGNDDSTRSIRLYCQLISDAALSGLQQSLTPGAAEFSREAQALQAANEDVTGAQAKEEADEEGKGSSRGRRGAAGGAKKAPTVVTVKKSPSRAKKDEE